jgi:hypothetical protein
MRACVGRSARARVCVCVLKTDVVVRGGLGARCEDVRCRVVSCRVVSCRLVVDDDEEEEEIHRSIESIESNRVR